MGSGTPTLERQETVELPISHEPIRTVRVTALGLSICLHGYDDCYLTKYRDVDLTGRCGEGGGKRTYSTGRKLLTTMCTHLPTSIAWARKVLYSLVSHGRSSRINQQSGRRNHMHPDALPPLTRPRTTSFSQAHRAQQASEVESVKLKHRHRGSGRQPRGSDAVA